MPGRVTVVGSVNLDVVCEVERLPATGETLAARTVRENVGGKGANQAVAAALAGATVTLVARVGADDVGERLRAGVARYGVDVAGVERVPGVRSGTAFITVDAAGENTIVIDPAANAAWPADPTTLDAVARAAVSGAHVVALQQEVPPEVVRAVVAAASARAAGAPAARVVLNAAPVRPVDDDVLRRCDPLVVNEPELVAVSGAAEVGEGLDVLLRRGAPSVVVTLGGRGARWVASATSRDGAGSGSVAAPAVDAVDSTGAGDAFVGVLAARLAEHAPGGGSPGGGAQDGDSLAAAVRWAVTAASLSVRRPGTLDSYPTHAAVQAALTP